MWIRAEDSIFNSEEVVAVSVETNADLWTVSVGLRSGHSITAGSYGTKEEATNKMVQIGKIVER